MDNIISIEVIECADERLIVSENGAEIGRFARPGFAAIEWARAMREIRRLKNEAARMATWLYSMTPDQVNDLDCRSLRAAAQEYRLLCQVSE